MMHPDLLVVENVKKHYPLGGRLWWGSSNRVRAVDGVSLVVKKGETLGLVGESGCGKSTLARCILRLEEVTEGKVRFENKDIMTYDQRTLRRLRREMQIVFQDPYSSLNPRMTVEKIIGESFEIHGILSGKARQDRVRELMNVVGLLPEHVHRYPHEFSGGQRQRICVARALSLNPKLIVADEPVSSLDVSIRAQILNLFVQLQKQFDLTYIFISHDLSVVRHISDRVAVMYLGKIVETGLTKEFFEKSLHPYTMALLSAVLRPDPKLIVQEITLKGEIPSPIHPPSGCRFHTRCAKRMEKCGESEPEMKRIGNREVACFLY